MLNFRLEPGWEAALEAFRNSAWIKHNRYRESHGVGPLQRDHDLDVIAQERFEVFLQVGNPGEFAPGLDLNENNSSGPGDALPTAERVVSKWYEEISKYDFQCPIISHGNAHFTQLIWKSSLRIGVGLAHAGVLGCNIVCVYHPSGNLHWKEALVENVIPPK